MYRGVMGDINAHVRDLGYRANGLPHNALEDAVIQAQEFARVLELVRG
jgi:hypothetical protein